MPLDDFYDYSQYYAPKNDFDEEATGNALNYNEYPNAPAELTDIPTSSLNAARPRTVAAGYDESRRVLTVVFRDGTVWNYFNVTPGQWQNFHASVSKGRPWLNDQLFGRGEPADMTSLNPAIYAQVYNAARRAQVQYRSIRQYKGPKGTSVSRVGKSAVGKARRSVKGINPSKGGKNPYKP